MNEEKSPVCLCKENNFACRISHSIMMKLFKVSDINTYIHSSYSH